jgi:hypothetical protein
MLISQLTKGFLIARTIYAKRKDKNFDLIFLDYELGDILADVPFRKIKELNNARIILKSA